MKCYNTMIKHGVQFTSILYLQIIIIYCIGRKKKHQMNYQSKT